MTYLASADLLAVRSLAAESAFSLDHRVDLLPKRSAPTSASGGGGGVGAEGRRARTFYSGLAQGPLTQHRPGDSTATATGDRPRTLTPAPEHGQTVPSPTRAQIDAAARLDPKGRHHRIEPAPEPEPVDEDTGFTVIDLRDQDTGFRVRTEPDHRRGEGAMAVVIELDAYRTPPGPAPTTPPPTEAGPVRRRSRRVRGYVRDLEPDERAEFATLRNTIRAYLGQKKERVA